VTIVTNLGLNQNAENAEKFITAAKSVRLMTGKAINPLALKLI
jgi:hypothetical protein